VGSEILNQVSSSTLVAPPNACCQEEMPCNSAVQCGVEQMLVEFELRRNRQMGLLEATGLISEPYANFQLLSFRVARTKF
jgi:hypothetical protein